MTINIPENLSAFEKLYMLATLPGLVFVTEPVEFYPMRFVRIVARTNQCVHITDRDVTYSIWDESALDCSILPGSAVYLDGYFNEKHLQLTLNVCGGVPISTEIPADKVYAMPLDIGGAYALSRLAQFTTFPAAVEVETRQSLGWLHEVCISSTGMLEISVAIDKEHKCGCHTHRHNETASRFVLRFSEEEQNTGWLEITYGTGILWTMRVKIPRIDVMLQFPVNRVNPLLHGLYSSEWSVLRTRLENKLKELYGTEQ